MKKTNTKLAVLGKRLRGIDRHLVHLLARRLQVACEVAMIKIEDGAELYRAQIERQRLAQVAQWAREDGINPQFARAMLYAIIGESCKTQMGLTDRFRIRRRAETFVPPYPVLRKNLLRLTKSLAPTYDQKYGNTHQATAALARFEQRRVDALCDDLAHHGVVVDLGCATGRELRRLSHRFEQLVGFDISPDMVREGKKSAHREDHNNISFRVHDVETTLPIPDASVSLVIMNCGTGSDVDKLPFVLNEIKRILKKGGRFLISFYNKESWVQQYYFPWPIGLAAGIDPYRNCLEVIYRNRSVPVFARPYTMDEVVEMMPTHLSVLSNTTFPTLTSILPGEIVCETKPEGVVEQLDEVLATQSNGTLGAYIVLTGERV